MHLVCLVLCLLLLTACGEAPAPASPSIVGTWVSEPTLSQLGHIVTTWTFEADGRVWMTGELADMEHAAEMDPDLADVSGLFVVKTSGRYEARDGTLRVTVERSSSFGGMKVEDVEPYEQTMTYRFEGDVLVLATPDWEDLRHHRR